MKKNSKSTASLALAALVSGSLGIVATDAQAAEALALGSGAELRGVLLHSSRNANTNETSPTPSPTPDSKSGEGKCGEGKCGGGKH